VGKYLYTPVTKAVTDTLTAHMGQDVELVCYLSGISHEIKHIEEIERLRIAERRAAEFEYPCSGYARGVKKGTAFKGAMSEKEYPGFARKFNLGEDVDVRAGTPVKSISDGTVMYSDFIPSWTSSDGVQHWGPGNMIVIQYRLAKPEGEATHICAVYAGLSADRKVKPGLAVTKGQVIGFVGKANSKENGKYPSRLHFGLHLGQYFQLSPAQKREIEKYAETVGLPAEDGTVLKGKVAGVTMVSNDVAEVRFQKHAESVNISLLVQSQHSAVIASKSAPTPGWCLMYGTKDQGDEWLFPTRWFKERKAR
jgi:murein DD-endopeptidase MepM/ murein hydrolase activator NlpD